MNNRIFLSTLVALALPASALAQDVKPFADIQEADVSAESRMQMPETWTFSDCIDWAVANSTDVRRSYLKILQADQEIGSSKDAWLPTVGFNTNHNFTNYPSPNEGVRNNAYGSSYNINAAWTVWEGNVRKYRLQTARLMKSQQIFAGDNVIKTIKLGILEAYLNIMYADEAVTIAKQTLEVSTRQTERALRLMQSGRTSKVDYAQIESQMAQDKYNLVQAQSNLATAKLRLKELLDLHIEDNMNVAVPDLSDTDISIPLPTMKETFDIAASWIPEIKQNDLNKEIYANDVKIAKAGNLPSITLNGGLGAGYASGGASWSSQMGHSFNESIGLSLSVPIYDGNSTRRAVAKAKLASLQYDLDRDDILDNLSKTIENLYIEAENSKARYSSGLTQLEATQLTADLVNRQFELGLVNPLEFLTAHNNLLNARLSVLQNKFMAILSNKTINYYATQQISLP
nr:transporter [uncultured Muribaculaceae bacterium]